MNPRRCARRTLPAILAAAILCATAGAAAQEVHKLVDATGSITFSDRPDETGALQVAPEAETPSQPKRIAGISSPRAAARVDAKEAARRLRQAQIARSEGIEPLPGERAQHAKTGVISERYWRRQQKLQLLVEQAQRRVNETSRPQVAAR
jgi:hypothetical protein